MSVVVLTQPLFSEAMALLDSAGIKYTTPPEGESWDQVVLRQRMADAGAIICLLTDTVDAGLMDAAPRLRIIANVAVGYDNIDVSAATDRGILVANTPDVLTETTADLALALILAVARRIPEADAYMRAGRYQGFVLSPDLLGVDVYGNTLGIVGLGRIGTAVARRASLGFGMQIIYADPRRKPEAENEFGAEHVHFNELLARSDFISLHTPLTQATRHLFTLREFNMMKHSAYLINTSRGPIVCEEDLVTALRTGLLRGAALDVFEAEPHMHPGLTNVRERVVVAPHIGSATYETRLAMATLAVRNVVSFLQQGHALTPVNSVTPAP